MILLRLLDASDPQHGDVRAALRQFRRRGDSFATGTQNVAEFWNVSTRPASARGGYGLSVDEVDRRVRILERAFRVLPDTPTAYPIWRRLVKDHAVLGVQVHDARVVALMAAHGVPCLLTLNGADFRRYPGIAAVSPQEVLRGAIPALPGPAAGGTGPPPGAPP